jgi:signal transduction histidine kinase
MRAQARFAAHLKFTIRHSPFVLMDTSPQPELNLRRIPSPSARLWIGLCVILSIFIIFAVYTARQIHWLEDFQANVVQRNRKASLQLLRLQTDAASLAISLRDMALGQSRYPIRDWRAEFSRLHDDMDDAANLEGQFAVNTPATGDKRAQLRAALQDFWRAADQVFVSAQEGDEERARSLTRTELESKRAVISEIVYRLLVLNDRAQADASERINEVYGNFKRNNLLVLAVLFLLALGTGLYTLQASRKTFEELRRLAEQLQVQSEQLRKLSWKLIDLQEATLRQVARDLHDEFGQILTAIGIMLRRTGQKAPSEDSPLVKDVQTVRSIVEDTLQNIRDRSQMFRPAILDDFGLETALKWFVEQFSRQTGVQVHLETRLRDGFFAPEDAIHVYRIVQEALSNVARHSGAHEAWISLEARDTALHLKIRDEGTGFTMGGPMNRASGEGIGLMGMRERAEHLGGTFTVRSEPQKGTVVSASIPLPKASSHSAEPRVSASGTKEKVG